MARYETDKTGKRKLVDKGSKKLEGDHPTRGRAAIIKQQKKAAKAEAEAEKAESKSSGSKKAKEKGGS